MAMTKPFRLGSLLLACMLGLYLDCVRAEALVFVQGYLSDADQWRKSGVTQAVKSAGWVDGGHLRLTGNGIESSRPPARGQKRFYTLSLPTEAPVAVQARVLAGYLKALSLRDARESLYLVGHSAGAVVARFVAVKHPELSPTALISIAAPHLGTDLAEFADALSNTPIGWLTPFLGDGALSRSRGLYRDLGRERPGNLLFWLNRQPHPDILYFSIVRADRDRRLVMDSVVPAYSQDMNHVAALRGRCVRLESVGTHDLNAGDGILLLRILARMNRS